MATSYESEVTFLSSVGADGRVAPISFGVWSLPLGSNTNPPQYTSPTSDLYKWGASTPGTGAAITYLFDQGSGWTSGEQSAFRGAMALWTAVANISITEVFSAAAADFQIVRGSDGKAVWDNIVYTYPAIGSTTPATSPASRAAAALRR